MLEELIYIYKYNFFFPLDCVSIREETFTLRRTKFESTVLGLVSEHVYTPRPFTTDVFPVSEIQVKRQTGNSFPNILDLSYPSFACWFVPLKVFSQQPHKRSICNNSDNTIKAN